ncbi:hypothetical protein PENTCL1PPCAC_2302, partial [Pristionchus entomophagus]
SVVVAPFRSALSMSTTSTRTHRTAHNALPRAKQNLSPKYFIPFEAIDRSIKLQEVSLTVSKRDENPIDSAFNARYKVTWIGTRNHFESQFNKVKHQLHNVLKEGKKPMERQYTDSSDDSETVTQQSLTYGQVLILLKMHYKNGGEIETDRFKKRFSTSSQVKDVTQWIESLKPTFHSCKDPVVIYELRGGVMPERQLIKLEPTQALRDIVGKSTFLPIVVDRSNMLYSE